MTAGPWVTFRCAGREFAVGVEHVVEMLSARKATPIPGSAPRLAGIVSWRGRTLPVLDLPTALKRDAEAPDLERRMLVLRVPDLLAVRVDEPGRILRAHDVEAVEDAEAEHDSPEKGVRLVRTGQRLVRVIDPARALGNGPLVAGVERTPEDRS